LNLQIKTHIKGEIARLWGKWSKIKMVLLYVVEACIAPQWHRSHTALGWTKISGAMDFALL
jgi:hypothetical protein